MLQANMEKIQEKKGAKKNKRLQQGLTKKASYLITLERG